MPKKAQSRSKTHRKHSRGHGERWLIVVASLVIIVAAASIGAMLALQYRAVDTPSSQRMAIQAGTERPSDEIELPVYEEPVDPAVLTPAPAVPRPEATTGQPGKPVSPARAPVVPREAADLQDRPKIAIVIDDLGIDLSRGARVLALPAPLTVAYLPYADNLADQTAAARRAGHELFLHLPMDPKNRDITDPGPNALLVDLDIGELRRRLDWNLSRFNGYVGVNNHMGSRFTNNAGALATVMAELRRRGLLFLDSRTSAASLALTQARRGGVRSVARDVFIDHIATPDAVRAALVKVEDIARHKGYVVAIGHPRDVTIDALSTWLPQIERRGFRLVTISALVHELYSGG